MVTAGITVIKDRVGSMRKVITHLSQLLLPILFGAIGVAYWRDIGGYTSPMDSYAVVIIVPLILVCIMLALGQIRTWATDRDKEECNEVEKVDRLKEVNQNTITYKSLLSIVSLAFFISGIKIIGFWLSATVFIAVVFIVMGERKIWRVILVTSGYIGIGLLVFKVFLQVPLP